MNNISRFVYQETMYGGQCLPCTCEVFNNLVDSQEVAFKIGMRQAVEKALRESLPLDEFLQCTQFHEFCDRESRKAYTGSNFLSLSEAQKLQQWATNLKQSLPCFIFGANDFDNSQRKLSGIHLSGLFMFDVDHLPCNPREIFELTQVKDFTWKLVLAHQTSSGEALRLVLEARPEIGNIADNQIELAKFLGLTGMIGTTGKPVVDNSCIDASRISFCPRREDIYYMEEFNLFEPVPTIFASKFEKDYREGKTAPTNTLHSFDEAKAVEPLPSTKQETTMQTTKMPEFFGHPVTDYIDVLLPDGAPVNSRHKEALKLADDLVILLDSNREAAHQVLLSLSWVQDIVNERGAAEITRIMDTAEKHYKKREEENMYAPLPSKRMRKAIEEVTKKKYVTLVAEQNHQAGTFDAENDIIKYTTQLGEEIKQFFKTYPLLALLCFGLKAKHFIAALFAGGAFGMSLMTRCWYRFYAAPGRKCRLNSILEIIAPPASGKGFLVDLYRIMMEPVMKSDEAQIEDLNRWKEEQLTKGANKDKSASPVGVLRCLPAESSAAAIRDAMINAKETINGEEWPLHVCLFDAELDNTIRQMKKGYMDIQTLYLKAFHNEPHGSLLKTNSAKVGLFDVHMNCVYSGTEFAFNKQINADNYTTGLFGRLTLVPMAFTNFEMMEKREYTEENLIRDEKLRNWANKLDKTCGEIPVKMLSDKLYAWTKNRMEDAKEDNSRVEEDLLKRCAWHGINYALPFIVSRHWNEMVEENGYFKPGVGFQIDNTDWKLCQLIVNAQLTFQRYFVGPIAEKFHDRKAITDASSHRCQTHTMECYMKLPQIFDVNHVLQCFDYKTPECGYSRIKRLQDDGLAQKIRTGEYKGKYKRLA